MENMVGKKVIYDAFNGYFAGEIIDKTEYAYVVQDFKNNKLISILLNYASPFCGGVIHLHLKVVKDDFDFDNWIKEKGKEVEKRNAIEKRNEIQRQIDLESKKTYFSKIKKWIRGH